MPFCPNCRCEYRSGFIQCSDCHIELVESLSKSLSESQSKVNYRQPDRSYLELVELASFPDPTQAQMIQELLKTNGIESVFQSDFNAGAGSFTASPNALLVRKVDFLKGREIFEQYFEGDQPEQAADDPDEVIP